MVALLTGCTRPSVPSPAPEKLKEGTRDRLPTMPVGRRDEQNGQGAVAELGMFLEDRILGPLASMLPSHFSTLVLLPPGCFSTFRCQACLGPAEDQSGWLEWQALSHLPSCPPTPSYTATQPRCSSLTFQQGCRTPARALPSAGNSSSRVPYGCLLLILHSQLRSQRNTPWLCYSVRAPLGNVSCLTMLVSS